MDHLTKWSITQPFGLRLAHRQRLWIRDNEGNLLGSSSEVGYSRELHEEGSEGARIGFRSSSKSVFSSFLR
ncbi:hypothetical protein LINGRAHAP2_LOCUS1746 [Linum grandiflorum]